MVLPPSFLSVLHCSLTDNLFYPAISSRITLFELAKKARERKKVGKSDASSAVISTPPTKRINIREKCPIEDAPFTLPDKASSMGKEAMPIPEPNKAKPMPKETTIIATRPVAPREGTSVNPVAALGPKVTMLRNSSTAKKILEACIPPFDKEEVDKLELDRIVSKLFHIIGQVTIRTCILLS